MKITLIICLIFSKVFGQDYVVNWINPIKKEPGIINYQIQTSLNNVTFTTLPNGTISPKKLNDTNKYSFILPSSNYYIRIKTLFTSTILYTESKKVVNTNVLITSPVLRVNTLSDNLSFTATNEAAVLYYSIERSNGGTVWAVSGKLMQTNKKNYVVNISKIGLNRKYRLRSIYTNGLFSPYINFIQ